jgi:secondary thiamine-phosphate synthase enzyme
MGSHRDTITVTTSGRIQAVNVTPQVSERLGASPVREGLLCVSVRHATCALALNEDESGLMEDLGRVAATMLDPIRGSRPFLHDRIDDNAQAHLTACVVGASVTVPVEGGRMVLGSWQSILLIELDGPRSRKVDLTVVG